MSVWWLHAILWSVLALNLLCSAQLQEPEDSDEQVTAQDESSESYTDGPDQSYSYDRVADQRDDLDDYDVKYRGEGDFETNFPDNQRAVASYSVTTDIFCWMGNSRISQTCSLERCDYWLTYNATKSFRGFACIRIGYSIDRIPHVYRNCVHTVSTKYDPCEQAIIEANSPRINVTSCEVCWDNGCNIHGYRNFWFDNAMVQEGVGRMSPSASHFITSWPWYLLLFCWSCLLFTCLYVLFTQLCKPQARDNPAADKECDCECDCEGEGACEGDAPCAGDGDAVCDV